MRKLIFSSSVEKSEILSSKAERIWATAAFVFFVFSCFVWISHQINFGLASALGLVVPDSVNLTGALQELWIRNILFDLESGYYAIAVLYGWTWLIHPSLCFGVNAAMMLANIALFRRVVVVMLGAPAWSVFGLLGNPYLILVMPGPNKEIPLLLLTLLLMDALFRSSRRWSLAFALCIPLYLLRDGYGLIMLVLVGAVWILLHRERLLPVVVFGISSAAAALLLPLSTLIPAIERNIRIYSDVFHGQEAIGSVAAALALTPFDPVGGLILYVLRIIYNLVSMAFFPVFVTRAGDFYWIGLAYWIYGLLVLMSLIGCAWRWLFLSSNHGLNLAASLSISVWLMVSLALFVQPRYLMPVLPVAFGVLSALSVRSRTNTIGLAIGVSLVVMFIYAIQGKIPPSATPEIANPPAYLIRMATEETH